MSVSQEHFTQPLQFQQHPRNSKPRFSAPRPAVIPAQIPQPAARRKSKIGRFFRRFFLVIAGMLVVSELVAVSFIWFTPPRTSFMLQNPQKPVVYQFLSLDHISRYMIAATVVHEDSTLGPRDLAFDLEKFRDRAIVHMQGGGDDPSGSTIPQQLVKNIFLMEDQNAVRKGIEALIATGFSLTLSDQRIMELYLNYAQFGPNIYGICAASWYYFDSPPSAMYPYHAAQLMGLLPTAEFVERAPGGGIYVNRKDHPITWDNLNGAANVWVPLQLKRMGGWKKAVATIGITDTAADHKAERVPGAPGFKDACTTPPEGVVQLLKEQGVKLDTKGRPIEIDNVNR